MIVTSNRNYRFRVFGPLIGVNGKVIYGGKSFMRYEIMVRDPDTNEWWALHKDFMSDVPHDSDEIEDFLWSKARMHIAAGAENE